MGAATTGAPTRRDYTDIGSAFMAEHKTAVEREIGGLRWTSESSAPMMPALGINECIKQLRIPKVSRYATNGCITVPDPPETATYSVYGIEATYRNAAVRIYVLDSGTEMTPLCIDVWEKGGEGS